MEPFASLEELQARLDWELDEGEERVAESSLEDASELARTHGREWEDPLTAPRIVRTLVLKACARYMKNYQGFTQSRAGDETVMWSDAAGENLGQVYFTKEEIKLLQEYAGRRTALISAPLLAYGNTGSRDNGYRPTGGGGKDFPMFEIGEQP